MAASHGIVVSPKDKNLGVLMSIVCSVYVCDECAARYVYHEIVGLWDVPVCVTNDCARGCR